METFHVASKEADLTRMDRPEDALDTSESVAIKKRERLFHEEGMFEKMLALKMALEQLTAGGFEMTGILDRGRDSGRWIENVIRDPRTYFRALDIEHNEIETLNNDQLNERVTQFLEKQTEPMLNAIRRDREIIVEYQTRDKSKALDRVLNILDFMQSLITQMKWLEFADEAQNLKNYVKGMQDMLAMTHGEQIEPDNLRKQMKAPEISGKK